MKRLLQLSFLAVAMLLLFIGAEPVQAQNYGFRSDGYGGVRYYRSRVRRVRRARRVKRRARRVKRVKRVKRAGRRKVRTKRRRYANYIMDGDGGQSRRRKARRVRKSRKKRVRKTRAVRPRVASFRKTVAPKKKKSASSKIVRASKNPAKEPVQIVVSLPRQRVSIYKGGKIIDSARISTGRAGHRTPTGVFSIIQKHKRHFSNLYNSAPMPYMQRITWSGIALHAGNVSRPYQSHGCIRLPYGFARKLFRRTSMGAHVIVSTGGSPLRSISHDALFQPASQGNLMAAARNVKTAAYTTNSATAGEQSETVVEAAPISVLPLGGIPGFVKPVEAAQKRLEEREATLVNVVAADPGFELALEGARQHLQGKKS